MTSFLLLTSKETVNLTLIACKLILFVTDYNMALKKGGLKK
jgi:hypothetical protein